MRRLSCAVFALLLAACGADHPAPVPIDTSHDACAECRMAVSSRRFASELLAPGEEPRFFDDLGCLAAFLRGRPSVPATAVVYVADHRTGDLVPGASAVFTRVERIETPMGSHVIAHMSAASRDADPSARGGTAVDAAVFFSRPLPGGTR